MHKNVYQNIGFSALTVKDKRNTRPHTYIYMSVRDCHASIQWTEPLE